MGEQPEDMPVAVNVMGVPEQMLVVLADMETETVAEQIMRTLLYRTSDSYIFPQASMARPFGPMDDAVAATPSPVKDPFQYCFSLEFGDFCLL